MPGNRIRGQDARFWLRFRTMSDVIVKGLKKTYRVHQKPQGLMGSVKSLFRREYKLVRAVDGITFGIEPGEMVGFLGPNGAGKTTTLKALSGLIFPTEGEVRVLGRAALPKAKEAEQTAAGTATGTAGNQASPCGGTLQERTEEEPAYGGRAPILRARHKDAAQGASG